MQIVPAVAIEVIVTEKVNCLLVPFPEPWEV